MLTPLGIAVIVADGPETNLQLEIDYLREISPAPLVLFLVNRAIERVTDKGHYLCTGHLSIVRKYYDHGIQILLSQPQSRWEPRDPHVTRFDKIRKGGSSAWDAVQIAKVIGYTRIVTIGVELVGDYHPFRKKWHDGYLAYASCLRGVSSFVSDLYGKPGVDWLNGENYGK